MFGLYRTFKSLFNIHHYYTKSKKYFNFFNNLYSDLDNCSFERREDGAYITYTPPGGADPVSKKLGSTILYVGSGSTIDIKSILPNEYSQLSINNFLTEITGTSVGWSKGGRASTTTPSYSLNKAYDSSTGIYTHNSKINNWTADVNEIKGGSDWAAGGDCLYNCVLS